MLVNQGGDNSERILRLEEQIQLLVDEDLTQALQNRKNFRILEDERPSKSFLNLENAKRGYNEVMLIKKVTYRQGIIEEFNRAFQKRWCTLRGNRLFYSEKQGDREPLGVIILEGCTVELAEEETDVFAFKVSAINKHLLLS